jgi:hypothetical protein
MTEIQKYLDGVKVITPIMNIMLNNRTKDWYDELGKYIVQNLEIEKIPSLQFFAEKLKEPKGLVKSMFKDRTYSSIAIFFLTSSLDPKALKKMFGTPLKHNEFGEGIEGSKFDYASYFVTVDGMDLHIGYDNRGTMIEVDVQFDMNTGTVLDKDAERTLKVLKALVDLYKEKAI